MKHITFNAEDLCIVSIEENGIYFEDEKGSIISLYLIKENNEHPKSNVYLGGFITPDETKLNRVYSGQVLHINDQ
jgi:hypothetical protein